MFVATLPSSKCEVNLRPKSRKGATRLREFLLTPPAVKQFQQLGASVREALTKAFGEGVESHQVEALHTPMKGLYRFRVGTIRVVHRIQGEKALVEIIDQRDSVYGTDYRQRSWKEGIPFSQVLSQSSPEAIADSKATSAVNNGASLTSKDGVETSASSIQEVEPANSDEQQMFVAIRKVVASSVNQNTRALEDLVKGEFASVRGAMESQRNVLEREIGSLFEQLTDASGSIEKIDLRIVGLNEEASNNRQSDLAAQLRLQEEIQQQNKELHGVVDGLAVVQAQVAQLQGQNAEHDAVVVCLRNQIEQLEFAATQQQTAACEYATQFASLRHDREMDRQATEAAQNKLLQIIGELQAEMVCRREASHRNRLTLKSVFQSIKETLRICS